MWELPLVVVVVADALASLVELDEVAGECRESACSRFRFSEPGE